MIDWPSLKRFTFGLRIVVCLIALASESVAISATPALAEEGVLNITGRDLKAGISLKGHWRFFWQKLIVPEQLLTELQAPAEYLAVPGPWNEYRDRTTNRPINGLGYGTYVLRIDGIDSEDQLGFSLPQVASSYKLWIVDAENPSRILLKLENGQVGTRQELSLSVQDYRLGQLFSTQSLRSVYVLIQVSNYSWIHGGMVYEPVFGHFNMLQRLSELSRSLNLMIMGVLTIIGLYNLCLFANRREDSGSLFLSIFCFALALVYLRTTANVYYLFVETSERNHVLLRSLYFVANPVMVASFNSFVRSNFPQDSFKNFSRFCWIWSAFIAVPLIFFQTSMPIALFRVYQYLGLLLTFVILYQIFQAVRSKQEGALISFLGSMVLIAAFINDYLTIYGILQSIICLPYAVVLFVLSQSQIVAIRFTRAFRQAEKLGLDLQQEVERQTRDIKSILKHIRQGIFTLVPPFKQVGVQYSDYLIKLLGSDQIVGKTIDQILLRKSDLSSDSKSQIEAALDATLGEKSLAFELNEALFVNELSYRNESTEENVILEVDWNPVVNRQDEVEKILISLRDVTEVRGLQNQAVHRDEEMKVLMELIPIPEEKFQRFLAKTQEYILENKQMLQAKMEDRREVLRLLFINMHTVKGAARTYSFKAIASLAHSVEQHYALLQRESAEWDQAKLLTELEGMQKILAQYQQIGESRLGWNSRESMVKIKKTKIEEDLAFLQSIDHHGLSASQLHHLEVLAERLGALCYDSLADLIEESARGLDSIARDLNKMMPSLVMPDQNIRLRGKGADFIYNVFLHLFRNSMDHGLESPELRLSRGKEARGKISISWDEKPGGVLIQYFDDGNGLDLEAIEAKAHSHGILQDHHKTSDNELASLIFLAGFSTKNVVSEVSGRGVGLDAALANCKSIGATIAIKIDAHSNRKQVPFRFEIIVPKSLFWLSEQPFENAKKVS